MELLTLQAWKAKRRAKALKNTNGLQSKKVEQQLTIELTNKLEEYLSYNDRLMIEVQPKVLGDFINILSSRAISIYNYQQVDKNKFIFYTKEIEI